MLEPDSPNAAKDLQRKMIRNVDRFLDAVRKFEHSNALLNSWRSRFLLAAGDATGQYTKKPEVRSILNKLRTMAMSRDDCALFTFEPTDGPIRIADAYEPGAILESLGIYLYQRSISHARRRIGLRQAAISGVLDQTRGVSREGGYHFRLSAQVPSLSPNPPSLKAAYLLLCNHIAISPLEPTNRKPI